MTNPDYLRAVADGLYPLPAGTWAAEKLDYLSRYIDILETSMRKKWSQRNYVDLFAGPGKNIVKDTKEVFLGSPLLALTTRFPFTGYYFSDNEPIEIDALKQRCSASPLYDSVNIYNENANQIVNTVVGNIRQFSPISLNLGFLDPFGLELEWSTVAKLGTLQHCDLIIHYSQYGLNLNIKQAYETNSETAVDRFFGTNDWRDIYSLWCNKPRSTRLHRELIDLYKERLISLGYQEVRQSDEMLVEPLIRNKRRNAPLYRLLFASKHPLGDEFWQKIIRRDVYGQKQMF